MLVSCRSAVVRPAATVAGADDGILRAGDVLLRLRIVFAVDRDKAGLQVLSSDRSSKASMTPLFCSLAICSTLLPSRCRFCPLVVTNTSTRSQRRLNRPRARPRRSVMPPCCATVPSTASVDIALALLGRARCAPRCGGAPASRNTEDAEDDLGKVRGRIEVRFG